MKSSVNPGLNLPKSFLLFLLPATASAGVFNMARFVDAGKYSLGFEPEVVTTDGGGVAGNLRFTEGVTELNDAFALVGTGTNVRNFRAGGGFTFDFIPDMDTQPGFGIGAQAVYYRYKGSSLAPGFGRLETALVPYVHKSFGNGRGNIIEPFLAIPFGPAFRSGTY